MLNPNTPTSRALPPGMRMAMVYRAIGESEPKYYKEFEYIGNAKRGLYVSNLDLGELPGSTKLYAFYIARYQSKTGKMGEFSTVLKVPIL